MAAIWDKLIAILLQTVDTYQIFLDLAQKKREILVEAKSRELELITRQEEAVILNAGKIEAVRADIISEIADLHGLKGKEITLSVLLQQADPNTIQQVTDISNKLDKILQELAQLNKLNIELIQRSLHYVNFNMNVLAQTISEPTYAREGQANPGVSRKIIDAKV